MASSTDETTGTELNTLAHKLQLKHPGKHRFTDGPRDDSFVVQITAWR